MIHRANHLPGGIAGKFLFAMLGLMLAAPAAADWLVTWDGARVKTKGPWKVKGNQVIFTLPNGTLSALRKSEIDLDASATATANAGKAAADPAQEQAPRRESVAVFNNSNIGRAEAPPEAAGDQGKKQKKDGKPPQNANVEVLSWSERERTGADGLEIVGTVRNNGSRVAAGISVKVIVVDEAGKTKLEATAIMRSTGLAPGRSTTFRVLLPGIFTLFTEPRFEVRAGGIEISRASPEEIAEEIKEKRSNP